MSSIDPEEVIDTAEKQQQIILAILFPLGLVMLFVSQSDLPILPVTATILLFAVVIAFYGVLFIEKIDI